MVWKSSKLVLLKGYPKKTIGYYFYFPHENKIVVARYAEFFEKNLITQEVSRRAIDFEEIQDEDTSPSEITSKIPIEVEGFKPPQEEVIPVCRSERTHQAPTRLCLNVEVEEHSLGDLNESASYKAAINPEAELRVDYYCNARFETDIDDMESQTEYVFILNGRRGRLEKLQKGARHDHRRCHYVRECIELSEINLLKVHTDGNLADPITKALPKGKLTQHARSMGLRLASSFIVCGEKVARARPYQTCQKMKMELQSSRERGYSEREINSAKTASSPPPPLATTPPAWARQGPHRRQTLRIRVADPPSVVYMGLPSRPMPPRGPPCYDGGPSSSDPYVAAAWPVRPRDVWIDTPHVVTSTSVGSGFGMTTMESGSHLGEQGISG
nr:retrotransposon protein, putative, Ty1-copia subclass [Tanacetum cinerariifolium]